MVLIDSHISQFVLVDSLSSLLIEMDDAIKQHMRIADDLAALNGMRDLDSNLILLIIQSCFCPSKSRTRFIYFKNRPLFRSEMERQ